MPKPPRREGSERRHPITAPRTYLLVETDREPSQPFLASSWGQRPRDAPSESRGLALPGGEGTGPRACRYPQAVATSERATALSTAEEVDGLGDMSPDSFRAAAHRAVDLMADYLAAVEDFPVLPSIAPGSVAAQLPGEAPED